MSGGRWSGKNATLLAVLGCALVVLLAGVAVAAGATDGSDQSPQPEAPAPRSGPVVGDIPFATADGEDAAKSEEVLACTGPREPVNFETFSAGPDPAGLPLTATVRRCDGAEAAAAARGVDQPSAGLDYAANYVSYIYGDCEVAQSDAGCAPPLEVQTWPACQRSMADYSFEGQPLPHREIETPDAAKIVEYDFAIERRIEVYTGSSTVVIFAADPSLAKDALAQLIPREEGKPPTSNAAALAGDPGERLPAPAQGATEGRLPCRS